MKILYILSVYNIYGGTPKKTLDLLRYSQNECYLYMYEDGYKEFKHLFENTGAKIIEGHFGRNVFKHLNSLLKLIDENGIQVVQTQFTMGEVLGYLIKLFRPHIKVVVAFVGPFEPTKLKKMLVNHIYKNVDAFVYISNYVQHEKEKQFPALRSKKSVIIFNGTERRYSTNDDLPALKHPALFSASGLVDWKNIPVLLEALHILKEKYKKQELFLYVAGDGPERGRLEEKISKYDLKEQVFLLGYQKNIGGLLEHADIYVHPAYAEGFGIAVAEAMMAEKPIIVSDAGALPELIENEKSGLVVDPFDAKVWAEAIIKLIENKSIADQFGENAGERAQIMFSIKRYIENYKSLYNALLEDERC